LGKLTLFGGATFAGGERELPEEEGKDKFDSIEFENNN